MSKNGPVPASPDYILLGVRVEVYKYPHSWTLPDGTTIERAYGMPMLKVKLCAETAEHQLAFEDMRKHSQQVVHDAMGRKIEIVWLKRPPRAERASQLARDAERANEMVKTGRRDV